MSCGDVYIKGAIVPSLKQDTVCAGRKALRQLISLRNLGLAAPECRAQADQCWVGFRPVLSITSDCLCLFRLGWLCLIDITGLAFCVVI